MFQPRAHERSNEMQGVARTHDAAFDQPQSMFQMQQWVGNQAVVQMAKKNQNAKQTPISTTTLTVKTEGKGKGNPASQSAGKQNNKIGKTQRMKYKLGQYGSREREKKRLLKLMGIQITKNTHEFEHVVGFEPINRTSNLKRKGQKGKGKERVRRLEMTAPAYYELEGWHAQHQGTGSKDKRDDSGMNSKEYRDYQRQLIEQKDVSTAIQLNQLGYAFINKEIDSTNKYEKKKPGKKKVSKNKLGKKKVNNNKLGVNKIELKKHHSKEIKKKIKASTDSYFKMIDNMETFTYAQGDKDVTFKVSAQDRAEMYLARIAMLTGKFPDVKKENIARSRYGLEPYVEENDKKEAKKEDKMEE